MSEEDVDMQPPQPPAATTRVHGVFSTPVLMTDDAEEKTPAAVLETLLVLPTKVAEGAMGILKRCRNTSTGTDVVIKTTSYHSSKSSPPKSPWDPLLLQEAYVLARWQTQTLPTPRFVHLQSLFPCVWPRKGQASYVPYFTPSSDVVAPDDSTTQSQASDNSTTQSRAKERLHLVLDYVSGGDLFEWSDQFQARPTPRMGQHVLPIIADLTNAVRSLHARGWAHRDIKPENILLQPENDGQQLRALLCDFGFSRPFVTAQGHAGTVEYHSPELWRERQHGPAADIWALGLTLHRIIRRSDPSYFDDMLNFYSQTAAVRETVSRDPVQQHWMHRYHVDCHPNRFALQRLGRDLECDLTCSTRWKMDAEQFRHYCAVQCVPPTHVHRLWYIYAGCLHPNPQQRWTADDIYHFLTPSTTNTSSTSSTIGNLSTRYRRPGYRFLVDGGASLLKKPSPSASMSSPSKSTSCPSESIPRITQVLKPRHHCRATTEEDLNSFASQIVRHLNWSEPAAVVALRAMLEILHCMKQHHYRATSFTTQKLAAIHLVHSILLCDPASDVDYGLNGLINEIVEQDHYQCTDADRTVVGDVQIDWLTHLLFRQQA